MSAFLIDDRGKVLDAPALALRLRWRASIDGADLWNFAILNLGFIGLWRSGGSVRIRLRPAFAKPAALGALYLWLHQSGPRRVVVSCYRRGWQHEIAAWNREGWRRITSLLESAKTARRQYSRANVQPRGLGAKNPLRYMLEDGSRFANLMANPARTLPSPLRGRFVLLTADANNELRVSDFGCTMMSRSPRWRSCARGLRIHDLPDWSYGQWVGDAYREAAHSGQPLLEEVSAIIQWPEHGMLEHVYWRLILPRVATGLPMRVLGVTLDRGPVGVH